MNNKLTNLNDYLFEQLERLNDEESLSENFDKEIERTKAITTVSQQIINNAKLALDAKKYIDEYADPNIVPKMLQIDECKDKWENLTK